MQTQQIVAAVLLTIIIIGLVILHIKTPKMSKEEKDYWDNEASNW